MIDTQQAIHDGEYFPMHLKGAEVIAKRFGVSSKTVKRWAVEGAPIYNVGRKYQANYLRLSQWLEKKYPVSVGTCQLPPSTSHRPAIDQ